MTQRAGYWRHWQEFGDFFLGKLKDPVREPTFILYFLFAILAVGGLGIWVSIPSSDFRTVSTNFCTTFLALAAASGVDLTLARTTPNPVKVLAYIVGAVLVIIAISIKFGPASNYNYLLSIPGYLAGLAMWWIANADNPSLKDSKQRASIGGNADQPTTGDTEGYQS